MKMYCYDKNLLNDNKRIVVMTEMYYNVSSIVNDGIGEVLCVSQKNFTNLKKHKKHKKNKKHISK